MRPIGAQSMPTQSRLEANYSAMNPIPDADADRPCEVARAPLAPHLIHPAARAGAALERVVDAIGRGLAYLVLVVVALLFAQFPLREFFQAGNVVANDFGQIVHAAVFMLGLSYAMRWDAHVRLDVLQRRFSVRMRAWISLIACLLLVVPWIALMLWYGTPVAWSSAWALESFPETYTPGYFVLKCVLPLAFGLLALQTAAWMLRSLAVLLTRTVDS